MILSPSPPQVLTQLIPLRNASQATLKLQNLPIVLDTPQGHPPKSGLEFLSLRVNVEPL